MSEPQRQVSAANPNMTGNPTKDEQFSANPLLEEYFSSTLIIWGVLCENFEIDKRMDLESKKIMDLLFVEVSMWSVTNSIALASTVKMSTLSRFLFVYFCLKWIAAYSDKTVYVWPPSKHRERNITDALYMNTWFFVYNGCKKWELFTGKSLAAILDCGNELVSAQW